MNIDVIRKNIVNIELSRPLLYKFLKKIKVKKICEVGVAYGTNLKHMTRCNPDLVAAVDIWEEIYYPLFVSKERVEKKYNHFIKWSKKQSFEVRVIRDCSLNAVKQFPDEFFDFVYIDANHTYDSVKADLEAWWSKVKKPGILAGHDYKERGKYNRVVKGEKVYYGVCEAVNEFVNNNDLKNNFYIVKCRIPNFFIIKG